MQGREVEACASSRAWCVDHAGRRVWEWQGLNTLIAQRPAQGGTASHAGEHRGHECRSCRRALQAKACAGQLWSSCATPLARLWLFLSRTLPSAL